MTTHRPVSTFFPTCPFCGCLCSCFRLLVMSPLGLKAALCTLWQRHERYRPTSPEIRLWCDTFASLYSQYNGFPRILASAKVGCWIRMGDRGTNQSTTVPGLSTCSNFELENPLSTGPACGPPYRHGELLIHHNLFKSDYFGAPPTCSDFFTM